MKYEIILLAAVGALLFAPGVTAEDGSDTEDECRLFEAWVYQPGSEMLFEAWVYTSWIENDCARAGDHAPAPLAALLP